MKLCLVQHGESEAKEINPDRPLTAKGWEDIKKLAVKLQFFTKAKIYHSGKLRAKQTAEILSSGNNIQQKEGLAPNDPIDNIVSEIDQFKYDLMIVGHLPFLGKLAGYLLTGDQNKEVVSFQQGSALCLEKKDDYWSVHFMVIPDIL